MGQKEGKVAKMGKEPVSYLAEGNGQTSPWALLQNQVYLSSENFIEKMQSFIVGDKKLSEIPSL